MASRTLTGSYTSFAVTANNYTLTNQGKIGNISVPVALAVSGTADTVLNTGTIIGASYAVTASQGLNLTNQSGGKIDGVLVGVAVAGAPGSVTNDGRILGQDAGIYLQAGGYVANQGGGLIHAYTLYAIEIQAPPARSPTPAASRAFSRVSRWTTAAASPTRAPARSAAKSTVSRSGTSRARCSTAA